jgi:hypothetical protein
MEPERRQRYLLAGLAVVLAIGLTFWLRPGPAASGPGTSNQRVRTQPGQQGKAPMAITTPDVHLEALESDRPRPGDVNRNLFRFKPKAAPPRPPDVPSPPEGWVPPPPGVPPPPAPAPSLPPIALKFVGVVEAPERSLRVAVLSDPRGVYKGREGDIIEGRYRIVRIGTESIEMSYLDGRGRQTIRLSGS